MNIGTEYNATYGYDDYGRLATLGNGTDTFNYSYLANSNLPSAITNGDLSANFSYESGRNLITAVENKYGTTTVSKYEYTNNA